MTKLSDHKLAMIWMHLLLNIQCRVNTTRPLTIKICWCLLFFHGLVTLNHVLKQLNLHAEVSCMRIQISGKRQRWNSVFEQYNWVIFSLFCACSLIWMLWTWKKCFVYIFRFGYVMLLHFIGHYLSAQWMNNFTLLLHHYQNASVISLACLFPDKTTKLHWHQGCQK